MAHRLGSRQRRFLRTAADSWDRYAAADPLWAVLSDPDRAGNRWDRDEFFATGRAEVDAVLSALEAEGILPPPGPALDFGCGVGRVTQALAARGFDTVGLDISSRMVDLARAHAGDAPRCAFQTYDGLALPFPDRRFHLVYSGLVLQHTAPALARAYIGELVRVLSPGGACVLQVPSRRLHALPRHLLPLHHLIPTSWRLAVRRLLDPTTPRVTIATVMPARTVEALVRRAGGRVVSVHQSPEPRSGFVTAWYHLSRP